MSLNGDDNDTIVALNARKELDEHAQADRTRKAVLIGDIQIFSRVLEEQHHMNTDSKDKMIFIMNWFHSWQAEFEAFVQVLDEEAERNENNQSEKNGSIETKENNEETTTDLIEMEEEALRIFKGFSKITMSLLEDLKVEIDSVTDKQGWTLLMQAANSGMLELVQALVGKYNANVNYFGSTIDKLHPLYLAIESEHNDVAMFLLQNGAMSSTLNIVKIQQQDEDDEEVDDNKVDDVDCAFFLACRLGLTSIVKEMLDRGVDIKFSSPTSGDYALHIAVLFENHDVVDLLLSAISELKDSKDILNATNKNGQTCLFGCTSVKLAKKLVGSGVDPMIRDVDDETAYSIAEALGDKGIQKFLATFNEN